MTFQTRLTGEKNFSVRWVIWFEGYPYYFTSWAESSGTWDDSVRWDSVSTHGEQSIVPRLTSYPNISGGALDVRQNRVGTTSVTFKVQDCTEIRELLATRTAGTELSADVTAAATSFTVVDSSIFAVGREAHIDRETVIVTAIPDSTHLTVTRGGLGSTAKPHGSGAKISPKPTFVRSRRTWLALGVQKEGSSDYEWYAPYLTGYLNGSPEFNTGQFSLKMSNSLDMFDKNFAIGFDEKSILKMQGLSYDDKTRNTYRIIVPEIETFIEPTSANANLSVMINADGRKEIYKVRDVTSDSIYIGAYDQGQNKGYKLVDFFQINSIIDRNTNQWTGDDAADVKVTPVYSSLRGRYGDPHPAAIALQIMLSDKGDGTNSATYDILPGLAATAGRTEIRAGAGLTSSEVDITAWEELLDIPVSSQGYPVCAEKEVSLIKFLANEICPMFGAYIYVNRNGKLSIRRYESKKSTNTTDYTVDDDVLLSEDTSFLNEDGLISSAKIYSNWDWDYDKYLSEDIAHFYDVWNIHGDRTETHEIQSKLINRKFQDITDQIESFMARWGYPIDVYDVRLPFDACLLEPGDTVILTNARLPDWQGSLGVSEIKCEVIGVGLDLGSGQVPAKLVRLLTSDLLAPTAKLGTNVSGNQWNVTNQYSDNDLDDDFAVGWRVQFITEAGTSHTATYSYATIAAVTSSTMTFTNPPTNIAANDIILLVDTADVSSTAVNASEGASQLSHARINDSVTAPSLTSSRSRY